MVYGSPALRSLALLVLFSSLIAACGEESPTQPTTPVPPGPSQPTVVRLAVTAPAAFATVGQPTPLVATASMSSGADRVVTELAAWSSSDGEVVSVGSDGVATPRRAGSARITASYSGQSAALDLLVPSVAAQPRTVRLLYLYPQDRELRADYERAIRNTFVDLQDWYRRQLGGPVFTVHSLQIEGCRLTRDAQFYLADSYAKVLSDAQRCLPVRSGDTSTVWVLYADVGHGCNLPGRLGVGSPGLTIMGQEDLQGLNDEPQINDGCQVVPKLTVGRWRGGGGHELGHAFGLPHPPGCDAGAADCDWNALMWAGYASYPNTYLRDDDKARLRTSPFFTSSASSAQVWDRDGRPR